MVRKMFRHAAAVAAASIISTPAMASIQNGAVSHIHFEGSRFLVYLDGPSAGASCNSEGAGRRYEIDASTELGRAQMSFILTVYATGQKIVISGTNACPSDTETIVYMAFLH